MAALSGYLALGTSSAGSFVERATSGYARQAISLVSGKNGESANAVAIKFPVAAGQLPYSAAAIYSASSGGSPLFWWEERSPDGFFDTDSKWTIPVGGVSVRFPAATAGDGGPLYADQAYHWRPDGLSSSSGAVGLTNFRPDNLKKWRKALANVRAGSGIARIACLGDSNTMGRGAGTGTNYMGGARAKSYPAVLAAALDKILGAQNNSWFGTNGVSSPLTEGYDPRISPGTGWAISGTTSLGGAMYQNSTTTNALAFTPDGEFDTVDLYYRRNTSYGSFTIDVDGGSALATINASGTGAILKQTVTTTLGSHTVNVKRTTGGNVQIVGMDCYDSSDRKISVLNMGFSGASTDYMLDFSSGTELNIGGIGTVAPDLTVICFGLNDAVNDSKASAFKGRMQSIITTCTAAGSDVVLLVPQRPGTSWNTFSRFESIRSDSYALSSQYDCPLIDLSQRLDYGTFSALGFYTDAAHPNALGYADIAQFISKALIF